MAIKKSDLYRSLWASCDELRGGMDASQYKDYVLTLLFVKYVSDKQAADPNSLVDVPDDASFAHLRSLDGNPEIGDEVNKAIGRLAEANDLRGVIDLADFNDPDKLGSGKDMVDRLSKLIRIFDTRLDFSDNKAAGDDLLGDAYEYLMRHFATESGKSKGQFYTPAEVSRVLAQVVGIGPDTTLEHTVYDPTCGSGSLLLKAGDQANGQITIYGQEWDNATWALAVMNAFLHNQPTAEIRRGNTLADPQFKEGDKLKTFDFCVANPPFSTKSWSNGLDPDNDTFNRFEYGTPPTRNGDYAFLLHIVSSLKSTGTGAVVLPHGVLFRGNAEATIRRQLLRRGLIKGVIGLPPNLFYGTGIPACIVVLDKAGADSREHVFMIDASRGFIKDGAKNRLRSRDLHRIVDVFTSETEIYRYSRRVPMSEIAADRNDYNLNIPRYIDSSEPDDLQDLHAHLKGGIPERDVDALSDFWEVFPDLRDRLFCDNRPGYLDLAVDLADLDEVVADAPEVDKLKQQALTLLDEWFEAHRPTLLAIDDTTDPKQLIHTLSEDLLERFEALPLLDAYGIYEQMMDYWGDVMNDDVFLLVADGWLKAAHARKAIIVKKGNKTDTKLSETADLEIGSGKKAVKYKTDLIPPHVIVNAYLIEDRDLAAARAADSEQASEAIAAFIEEYGTDEESLVYDALNDKDALTQKGVKEALSAVGDGGDKELVAALEAAMDLLKAEAAAKKAAREATAALNEATLKKYGQLTEGEVQHLVLDAKWRTTLRAHVADEVDTLIARIPARVHLLAERYAVTLGQVDDRLAELGQNVHQHLVKMGVEA